MRGKFARIVTNPTFPKNKQPIMGMQSGEVLKPGFIYEIIEMEDGIFQLKEIGEADGNHPEGNTGGSFGWGASFTSHFYEIALRLFTKSEQEKM